MAPAYHLWLQPTGRAYDTLENIISDLSTTYASPSFEPHVTLLGSLPGSEEEINRRVSHLGACLQPLDLHLIAPAYGDRYFQCIFFKARESPALIGAYELANNLFGNISGTFMPHLSLMYGNVSLALKKQIIAALPDILPLNFTVDKVHLIRAESQDPQDWSRLCTVHLRQ